MSRLARIVPFLNTVLAILTTLAKLGHLPTVSVLEPRDTCRVRLC